MSRSLRRPFHIVNNKCDARWWLRIAIGDGRYGGNLTNRACSLPRSICGGRDADILDGRGVMMRLVTPGITIRSMAIASAVIIAVALSTASTLFSAAQRLFT